MRYAIVVSFLFHFMQVSLAVNYCPDGTVCGIIGWFFTVSCKEQINEAEEFLFARAEEVSCMVAMDGELLANISVEMWRRRRYKYKTFSFAPEMEGKNISITWQGQNKTIQRTRVITAMNVSSCGYSEDHNMTKNIQEVISIRCSLPKCMKLAPQDEINFTWYRDEKVLNIDGNYTKEKGLHKAILKIRSASYTNAPGFYRCDMKHNGNILSGERTQLCIFNRADNNARITAERKVIQVEPGGTAELRCRGNTGTGRHSDSYSQGIRWIRKSIQLCKCNPSGCEYPEGKIQECSWNRAEGSKICGATENEDILQSKRSEDQFNSSLILRNLSVEDSGTYICKVFGTGLHHNNTIELVVRHMDNAHSILRLAVCNYSFLHYWNYVESISSGNESFRSSFSAVDQTRYVAYLLYSNDAYNSNSNPIEDVVTWMHKRSYPFYDRQRSENDEANDAGALLSNHVMEKLEQSACLIIFLTQGLVNENTWELFEAFEGLNKNIQDGLRIVFICSQDMRKTIQEESRKNSQKQKTCATFERFMNMQNNYVIEWKEDKQKFFQRCLYIAVPKLQ